MSWVRPGVLLVRARLFCAVTVRTKDILKLFWIFLRDILVLFAYILVKTVTVSFDVLDFSKKKSAQN